MPVAALYPSAWLKPGFPAQEPYERTPYPWASQDLCLMNRLNRQLWLLRDDL